MNYQLKQQLHQYFSSINHPTEEEKEILRQLADSLEWFDMRGIDRDDLKSQGYNIDLIPDEMMDDITDRLDRAYRENVLPIDLPIIAEIMNVPMKPTSKCPVCSKKLVVFNSDSMSLECLYCGFEKAIQTNDLYVLVQFPEDSSYFEDNDIGYPSYESEDNGARFVSEEDYIKAFVQEPDASILYKPIGWPEIQVLMEDPKFETYTEPILDEKGLADFGSSAYWIPLCYCS